MLSEHSNHPFDQAIRLAPGEPGSFAGETSPAYANFVGPFGGVTAATLLQAALVSPERRGEPVSFTVNFAAPIADGGFTITARAARTNRSTQHWVLEMRQGDAVVATATAVFALRRETWQALDVSPPEAPPAQSLPALAWFEALPVWIRNYRMHMARGEITLQDQDAAGDSVSTLWLRDDPPRPLDFPAITALSDAFFPRIFVRRQRFAPIGTVTMTVYFHADQAMLDHQGTEPLLATARASRFRDGYFDQVAELWGKDDELLATTHQLVYYRE